MAAARPSGDALIAALEQRTGYRFADAGLAEQALTHSSVRGGAADYERLEFLGDRVLGLVVAEMLFRAYPDAIQGELSVRLNALVTGDTCAAVAEEIGLVPLIRSDGIRALDGRKARGIRADAMEALIAAIYLDGGLEAARAFITRFWRDRAAAGLGRRDPKTALQEWAHQATATTPVYEIVDRQGPDHAPVFRVSVAVNGMEPALGTGRSKREAEQAAANALLEREGVREAEPEVAR